MCVSKSVPLHGVSVCRSIRAESTGFVAVKNLCRKTFLSVLINVGAMSLLAGAGEVAREPARAKAPAERPSVVRNQEALEASMRQGATPLDAFTAFGRREFLAGLVWSDGGRGLGGLSAKPMIRELRPDQIVALMAFLGLKDLGDSIAAALPESPPLRFPEPGVDVEKSWRDISDLIARQVVSEGSSGSTTDLGHDELIARYRSSLGRRIDNGSLSAESLGNLLLLFDTAAEVAMISGDATAGESMRAVFDELERRHVDTRRSFNERMRNALLAQRQFEQARAFLVLHPDPYADTLPKILDPLGPAFEGRSVLDFDPAAGVWKRVAVPTAASTQIILLVGPTCHFSANALADISKDLSLLARLREHNLVVLTPPSASLQFAPIAAWNAQHRLLPMRIPWSRAEWKYADGMQVPQFLIFENGKLAQRIVGWEGHQSLLSRALDRKSAQ